jgi:hypothetical protein
MTSVPPAPPPPPRAASPDWALWLSWLWVGLVLLALLAESLGLENLRLALSFSRDFE